MNGSMKALALGLLLAATSASAQSTEPCERACLEGFLDQYVDALVAQDPAQLPLADSA